MRISVLLPIVCLLGKVRVIAVAALVSATVLSSSPSLGFGPFIDRFEAVADCIFPDPRRGILSYMVTLASRVRVFAIEEIRIPFPFEDIVMRWPRGFHEGRGSFPSSVAAGIPDPGATANVVAYELVATAEDGAVQRRRIDFRYRRAVVFDLFPSALHFRTTGPEPRETRYEAATRLAFIRILGCSFRFDFPVEGEAGRAGLARVFEAVAGDHGLACTIVWRSEAKARAAGTVEWTARATDSCTPGIMSRRARVRAIP